MKKYSYYTPVELARGILNLLPDIRINTIIDICCGSWNLLNAAKEKYPTASIVGVDIDSESEKHRIIDAEFHNEDGREFALNKKNERQTFDLILSNPPFGYLDENNRKYSNRECVAEECYSGLLRKRYEGEMIQANLFLAHDESLLLFILPSTFVNGETFREVRCQISHDYRIYKIIKLPSNTFERGNINTFAIIMKKEIPFETMTDLFVAKKGEEWQITQIGRRKYADVKKGNWWLKMDVENSKESISLYRGNLSSCNFTDDGEMVFHSALKVGVDWKPSIRYYNTASISFKIVRAQVGDILINRVGKGVGYWCQNTIPNVAISDCIIVVKNSQVDLVERFKKNSTVDGRLKVPVRGVVTPYLTTQDIKSVIGNNAACKNNR